MNPHFDEETDAFYSRNDRFDGFDRGDLDWNYDAEQLAQNEAFMQENHELFR